VSFTRDDVLAEAKRRLNGKPVCTDELDDAMSGGATLEDAVMYLLLDTVMWDSDTGNPFDKEVWAKIID
jgi:hypothetical protein